MKASNNEEEEQEEIFHLREFLLKVLQRVTELCGTLLSILQRSCQQHNMLPFGRSFYANVEIFLRFFIHFLCDVFFGTIIPRGLRNSTISPSVCYLVVRPRRKDALKLIDTLWIERTKLTLKLPGPLSLLIFRRRNSDTLFNLSRLNETLHSPSSTRNTHAFRNTSTILRYPIPTLFIRK